MHMDHNCRKTCLLPMGKYIMRVLSIIMALSFSENTEKFAYILMLQRDIMTPF